MCGLAGEIGAAIEGTQSAEAITGTLFHRGPDQGGQARGDGWWLGFRRLSILDLTSTGHQPMSSEDGRYWLVFNGEIYNYRELAEDLVSRGVRLRGSSDTEVLLNLLVLRGADCLSQLNGMFAFALLDIVERRFLIARDRLGVKPLYWTMHRRTLRFASELKTLLAWPDAPRSLNRQAIRDFLSLGYLPSGGPIFESYHQLPPGNFAEGSLDGPTVDPKRYWTLHVEPRSERVAKPALDEFQALLTDAVRIRLRSDVKLGLFLSGGIDSALVAAIAGQLGNPVMALTVGFREADFDETALASKTAEKFGLEHQIIPQRKARFEDIDELAKAFDEPFGDPSALSTMLLCSAAARQATVFLSGDGGDEAFGGYNRYIKASRLGWLTGLPSVVTGLTRFASSILPVGSQLRYKLVKAALHDRAMAVFDGQGLLADPVLPIILPPDLKRMPDDIAPPVAQAWCCSSGSDILSRQRDLDYRMYLPDDVLVKVDRASMAQSIEVRSPFLDYRVVEWAARLSKKDLVANGNGKVLLRRIAGEMLPEAVTRAPKRGFRVPVGDWFRKEGGKKLIRERLLEGNGRHHGLWDPEGVEELLRLHLTGGRNLGVYLWRLTVLEAWARHYLAADLAEAGAERSHRAKAYDHRQLGNDHRQVQGHGNAPVH